MDVIYNNSNINPSSKGSNCSFISLKMAKFGRPTPEIEGLVAASGLSPLIACSLNTGDREFYVYLPVVGAFHSFEQLHVDDVIEMLVELLEVSIEEAKAKTFQCHGSYVRLSWLQDVYQMKIEACHWIIAS